MSVALMYHALYRDDDISSIDKEDLPYAVSESDFVQQLEKLKNFRVGLLDQNPDASQQDIILTFDDGHASNHDIALAHLQEFGYSAYFFITTDFIDNREYFCTSGMLKNLADAGMVIGGHGCSHAFFDDLMEDAAIRELSHSARTLREITQQPVTSMSFPGGRYNKQSLALAHSEGFSQLFGSGFGTIEFNSTGAFNRVAVRRTTRSEEFDRIIHHDHRYYRQEQLKQQAKGLLKKCLGNRFYHGLYKSITARN